MIRKYKLISTYMIVINKTSKQKNISYRDSSRRERNDVNFVILKRRAYLKRMMVGFKLPWFLDYFGYVLLVSVFIIAGNYILFNYLDM